MSEGLEAATGAVVSEGLSESVTKGILQWGRHFRPMEQPMRNLLAENMCGVSRELYEVRVAAVCEQGGI